MTVNGVRWVWKIHKVGKMKERGKCLMKKMGKSLCLQENLEKQSFQQMKRAKVTMVKKKIVNKQTKRLINKI